MGSLSNFFYWFVEVSEHNWVYYPGRVYVIATLLPLLSFLVLLLANGLRSWLRKFYDPDENNLATNLYNFLGGDKQNKVFAWIGTATMGLAFCLCLYGFIQLQIDHASHGAHGGEHAAAHHEGNGHNHGAEHDHDEAEDHVKYVWAESVTWVKLNLSGLNDSSQATELKVGYYIDSLSAIMFLMVTFIATLIHLFSQGYMDEELVKEVEDHEVHTDHGHLHRRSRYTRFFTFLSLFCFSMLNLILADNLFQIFVSWELVGICSFLLIGFYYERQSASNAANKAFITNRVGDAGFIIGILILWTYLGTLNFQEVFSRLRSPQQDSHNVLKLGGQIVRANPTEVSEEEAKANARDGLRVLTIVENKQQPSTLDTRAIIFPKKTSGHFHGVGPGADAEVLVRDAPEADQYSSLPYWMLVVAGLGIFLGCVGKSAQFPLHVWLPDAMEGPTPVSALIHAATMVAAGVYLVGRAYPIFTTEVLLVIAYTGAITLFVAATIAVVMTDIKKVLAYSTVSQLGYMMLALGLGGWVAGLMHLVTHAFFKALLFLGSGSVIYGCHHVQEMPRMGGLFPKMKITALTMLVGVFAIAGIPLFSGWYSKDAIVAQALGYGVVHPEHFLLTLLPFLTAGITTFYMFRMWFMTFAGKPKDHHVYEHAHETAWQMTVPLILLAIMSVIVAWPVGKPLWIATESELEHQIHHAQPLAVIADFGGIPGKEVLSNIAIDTATSPIYVGYTLHDLAGLLALATVIVGFGFAAAIYWFQVFNPKDVADHVKSVGAFLANKWHFDELYSSVLIRPSLIIAHWCRAFDTYVIDGTIHAVAKSTVWFSNIGGLFDKYVIDGLVNLLAAVCAKVGTHFRRAQTGYLRSYVLFLVLATVSIWVVLSLLVRAS